MLYGYARQTVFGPAIDEQKQRLARAGCGTVFVEEIGSGRAELGRALHALQFGDVLIVTSLDRLASSIQDLCQVVQVLADAGAGLRSLAEPWADPTKAQGRYFLTMLRGLSKFEEFTWRDRLHTARAAAVERGVRFGPPGKLTDDQIAEAREAYRSGRVKLKDLAKKYGVAESTMSRQINKPVRRK